MKEIIYKKDGIWVDDFFIGLSEINQNCQIEKIKEDKLLLLKMEWKGWRGFDKGIVEKILLPIEKIESIKKHILGKTIHFGEIAGKHSDVYNTLDENDIEIIDNQDIILEFLKSKPNGHEYNHSFLLAFYYYASDGGYDGISEADLDEISTCFN